MVGLRRRSLVPWAFRSHRIGMLALGLGFGALVAILAPAYVTAAKALAGGLQALATAALPVAQSFEFLTGPVDRLDTVGGYLSYKIYPDIALLVAIYAAIQGTQVIRGSESKGIVDLWFAAGRPRTAIFRDRVIAFLAALTGAVILLYILTVAGGAAAGVQLALPALGQCVAVGLVGFVGFAVGLFASQFFSAARTAAGLTCAYLVAAFFVANLYNQLGALTFLRYLSPFYYYIQARTLAGITFDTAAMAALLVGGLAFGGAALWLFLRRDAGGVILLRDRHSSPVDYTFRPSLLWRRYLWLSWIAEQPLGLASWALGIGAFAAVEAAVVPSAIRLVNTTGGQLRQTLAKHLAALTPSQYLSFFISFTALLAAGFMVAQVARWASDATQHRVDVVLTQPVSMSRFITERAVSVVFLAAVIGLSVVVGTWIGTVIGGYPASAGGLLRTLLDIVLLGFAIGGVGLVATAVLRSSAATGVTGGILVVCFFLTTVAGLLAWPSWTSRPSVFDAFGTPYLSWPVVGSLVYLAALGVVGSLMAYLAMRRGMRIAV